MTDLLERTDLDEKTTDSGDGNDVAHFFHKKALDDLILNGTPATALCGFVKQGQQKDYKGMPVCKMCSDLVNTFPPGDDE